MKEDTKGDERLIVDVRGKTLDEVAALVKKLGLGPGTVRDVTFYYECLELNAAVPTFCVDLYPEPRMPRQTAFVLWDDKEHDWESGKDLHLFDPDGSADWGYVKTSDIAE